MAEMIDTTYLTKSTEPATTEPTETISVLINLRPETHQRVLDALEYNKESYDSLVTRAIEFDVSPIYHPYWEGYFRCYIDLILQSCSLEVKRSAFKGYLIHQGYPQEFIRFWLGFFGLIGEDRGEHPFDRHDGTQQLNSSAGGNASSDRSDFISGRDPASPDQAIPFPGSTNG